MYRIRQTDGRTIFDNLFTHDPLRRRKRGIGMRRSLIILLTLLAALSSLTACDPMGRNNFKPDASVNATTEFDVDSALSMDIDDYTPSRYIPQEFNFVAEDNGSFDLRIHLRDDYCNSFDATVKTTSQEEPARTKFDTYPVLELDYVMYDYLDDCKYTEGDLDVTLTPGVYTLWVDDQEEPVTFTIFGTGQMSAPTTEADIAPSTEAEITTSTIVDSSKVFTADEIIWTTHCSDLDMFCADFPEVPEVQSDLFGGFQSDTIEADGDNLGFRAYGVDLPRGLQDAQVVFCNDYGSDACDQEEANHGVNVDGYSVYVGPDEAPGRTLEGWDADHGDCGGRPNRQVSEITIDGVDGAKITCGQSYNPEAGRTLYIFRRNGLVYEVIATNQTLPPYFEQEFLDSFRFTR